MSNPLRKSLSLPHVVVNDIGPNDYRNNGNAQVVRDTTTRWIKVWIDWNKVQGDYPAPHDVNESWAQINAGGNGAMVRLDTIIRRINIDSSALQAANGGSYGVILCLNPTTPPWARFSGYESNPNAFPADVSTNSYWGWWFGHLCARYGKPSGNSLGAYVNSIEVCNEPNLSYFPKNGLACGVATMLKSAENLQAFWAGPSALLGPGVLDIKGNAGAIDYDTFTSDVLDQLQGWSPRAYFGWSMHNYNDIKNAVLGAPASGTRVANVQNILQAKSWKTNGERRVWLTEGGFVSQPTAASEREQQDRIYASYAQMQALSDVPIWTNHLVVDPVAGPGQFTSGLKHADLSAKPALATWQVMPAANTPL